MFLSSCQGPVSGVRNICVEMMESRLGEWEMKRCYICSSEKHRGLFCFHVPSVNAPSVILPLRINTSLPVPLF